MVRVHFSIAGLMGTIAAFALAWASGRYASRPVADLVFTATLGVLGFAAFGALFRVGRSRVRSAGFAILGGGYLALGYGPGSGAEIRPHLTTSTLLGYLGPIVVHPRVVTSRTDGKTILSVSSILAVPDDLDQPHHVAPVLTQINSGWPAHLFYRDIGMGDPEDFQRIGHSWLALLLGWIGGLLAPRFRPAACEPRVASP